MNTAAKLPPEFMAYWLTLVEASPRSMMAAYWQLIGRWEAGYDIPGYGTWQAFQIAQFSGQPLPTKCPRGFQPRGWSARNLARFKPQRRPRTLVIRTEGAKAIISPTMARAYRRYFGTN